MSNRLDATGAGEDVRKERTPKEHIPVIVLLGHGVKNYMTVISVDVELSVNHNCAVIDCI